MFRFSHLLKDLFRLRLYFVATLFAAALLLVVLRMGQIQIVKHEMLFKIREKQALKSLEIKASRGRIYDRDGSILAAIIPSVSIYADPSVIAPSMIEETAEVLHKLTEMPKEEVIRKLNSDRKFVWIKRKMNIGVKEKLDKNRMVGVGYRMEDKRDYPENELACHVLGFVGIDNQGLTGIEFLYDRILQGENGFEKFYSDALGRQIPTRIVSQIPAKSGVDLHLTLSRVCQSTVDRELKRCAFRHKIEEGIVIIMRAFDGQIFVMSNYPSYNPNNFLDYSSNVYNRNAAIQELVRVDPVLMLIMTGVGLERLNGSDLSILGKYKAFDEMLRFSDSEKNLFRNLCEQLGEETLCRYLELFGVGRKTGISMPGESEGRLILPIYTSGPEGILMTPLQIARIIGAVVNDGVVVNPLILMNYRDKEGKGRTREVIEHKRVLLKGTANALKQLLMRAVAVGDARDIRIEGYEIGGMGHKIIPEGGQNPKGSIFVGFIKGNSIQENFIVFTMTKMKGGNMEKSLKITKELFRATVYETLRYFEDKKMEVASKSSYKD